jgi:hypothetical protein
VDERLAEHDEREQDEADELEGRERRREHRGTAPGIGDLDRLEDLVHGRNLFASR